MHARQRTHVARSSGTGKSHWPILLPAAGASTGQSHWTTRSVVRCKWPLRITAHMSQIENRSMRTVGRFETRVGQTVINTGKREEVAFEVQMDGG